MKLYGSECASVLFLFGWRVHDPAKSLSCCNVFYSDPYNALPRMQMQSVLSLIILMEDKHPLAMHGKLS